MIPCTLDLLPSYASARNKHFKVREYSKDLAKSCSDPARIRVNAIQETLMTEFDCFLCRCISVTSGLLCYSWKAHFWLSMFD